MPADPQHFSCTYKGGLPVSSMRYFPLPSAKGSYEDQEYKMRDVILDDFYASLPLEE